MMTPAELKAIRERCEAATEGPWWSRKGHGPDRFAPKGYGLVAFSRKRDEPYTTSDLLPEDAEFMAHARSDIPALLSVIAQLRQQRDEAWAKCERIATSKDFYVRKTEGLKQSIEKHECNPAAPENKEK